MKLKFQLVPSNTNDYKIIDQAANLDRLTFEDSEKVYVPPTSGWIFVYANINGIQHCVGKVDISIKTVQVDNHKYNQMHLANLAVIPSFQGNGIASKILEASESVASKNNCKIITLFSDSSITKKDIKHLENAGFNIDNYIIYEGTKKLDDLQKNMAYNLSIRIADRKLPNFFLKRGFGMVEQPCSITKTPLHQPANTSLYVKPLTHDKYLTDHMVMEAYLPQNSNLPTYQTHPFTLCNKINRSRKL